MEYFSALEFHLSLLKKIFTQNYCIAWKYCIASQLAARVSENGCYRTSTAGQACASPKVPNHKPSELSLIYKLFVLIAFLLAFSSGSTVFLPLLAQNISRSQSNLGSLFYNSARSAQIVMQGYYQQVYDLLNRFTGDQRSKIQACHRITALKFLLVHTLYSLPFVTDNKWYARYDCILFTSKT